MRRRRKRRRPAAAPSPALRDASPPAFRVRREAHHGTGRPGASAPTICQTAFSAPSPVQNHRTGTRRDRRRCAPPRGGGAATSTAAPPARAATVDRQPSAPRSDVGRVWPPRRGRTSPRTQAPSATCGATGAGAPRAPVVARGDSPPAHEQP